MRSGFALLSVLMCVASTLIVSIHLWQQVAGLCVPLRLQQKVEARQTRKIVLAQFIQHIINTTKKHWSVHAAKGPVVVVGSRPRPFVLQIDQKDGLFRYVAHHEGIVLLSGFMV